MSALSEAATAAIALGLEAEGQKARDLLSQAEERLGFEGSAYVLALVGGTGVGKSSLLNALAAGKVSEVGVIRPTTARPLAWVPGEQQTEIEPLLGWLGINEVVSHPQGVLDGVVVLDLPDFDSVELGHRATVDRLVPRIDSMLWVVDSEKYDDELLYTYLRELTNHADRIGFVFNKADRLEPAEQRLIVDDFVGRLKAAGYAKPSVHLVSARTGEGLDSLLASLKQGAKDKELINKKLESDFGRSLHRLAAAAGVEQRFMPLVETRVRKAATDEAVRGALAIVDPDGLANQVKAAVLYRARRQGGSLLARILALLANLTGTRRRSADPEGFLFSWRQRGSMGHVLNPIRRVIVDAVSRLPSAARPRVMQKVEFEQLEQRLTRAVEGAVRGSKGELEVPASILWVLVGGVQLLLGAGFLFAVAWYLTLIFGPGGLPVGTVDIPYLGPVPIPLVLLVGSLVTSLLLGLLLTIHATWIGRRRGGRVAASVRTAISRTVEEAAFGPLDEIEDARRRLSAALTL